MINGVHVLLYSTNPEADRAFLRDVLGFRAIDIGEGWLIFGLPPTEAGVHPGEPDHLIQHGGRSLLGAVIYLMCNDLKETMAELKAKRVECSAVEETGWGVKTTLRLPSGGELGLYQPRHPTAIAS
jgi:catechol 2,3-dioxygenase-like lactoylglutathione lyase family enzyme